MKLLKEELSYSLAGNLKKHVQKFLLNNEKEILFEIDRNGWEKVAEELAIEFSVLVDDYLEAVSSYKEE